MRRQLFLLLHRSVVSLIKGEGGDAVTKSTALKKDWRFYTGMTFLVMAVILPLFGFLVPLLDIPTAAEVFIIACLTVGGPELMIMFAVAFLGKRTFVYIKAKIFAIFKRKRRPKPVSITRYYIGLAIFILSPRLLYFNAYWPEIMPAHDQVRYYLLVIGDLAFVISFFILGERFWEKFKSLFIWNV